MRLEVGDYVQCFMQDGATFGYGYVEAVDARYVTVRLETLFPGAKVKYELGSSHVKFVSNG